MSEFIVGARGHDFGRHSVEELLSSIGDAGFRCTQLAYTKAVDGVKSYADVTPELVAATNAAVRKSGVSIFIVLLVLLFTFQSVGMPILLIVVIQGAIWINFSFPYFMGTNLYFMGYLIVSSIQMGANIDYAIVIATRFNELKDKMEHKQAMIETINFAFPTILTSGTIMTVSGLLIGQMTSDACIVGIGQCLGRGTIISILLVLFVLPQILLIGTRIVDRTSFAVPKLVARSSGNGRMRVNGIVQGEIHGSVAGTMNAIVDGDVQLTVISGNVSQELDDNKQQEVQNEDQ